MPDETCLVCNRFDDVVYYVQSLDPDSKYTLLLLTEIEHEDTDILCFGCNGKLSVSTSFLKMCSTSQKCLERKSKQLNAVEVATHSINVKSEIPLKEVKTEESEEYEQMMIEEWMEEDPRSEDLVATSNDVDENTVEMLDDEYLLEPESIHEEEATESMKPKEEELDKVEINTSKVHDSNEKYFEFELTKNKQKDFIKTKKFSKVFKTSSGQQQYICESCGKSFSSSTILRNHSIQVHGSIRPEIQRHLLRIKEGDIYHDAGFNDLTCSFCFEKFDNIENRASHEESHRTEIRPYKCFVCSASFLKRSRLREHYEMHQNNTYKCSMEGCNKLFKSKHGKWAHEYKHKNRQIICPTCGKILSTIWALNQHNKTVHTELPLIHACEKCPKKFKSHKALYGHSLLHDPSNKKHECSTCHKKFLTKSKLERHYRHHTGEKPFNCIEDGCQYKCTNNYNLKRHILTHGINLFEPNSKIATKEEIVIEDGEQYDS